MKFALTAVLWIGLLAATRAQNTYYVATNGTGNGTTWTLATSNIQAAVDATVANDIVLVSNGTYYCWSNSVYPGYTSMVTVTKDVTIQSVNGPEVTIVDANYPVFTNRCFYIYSANAVIAGFTITNGHTKDENSGGGVYLRSGKVTNCWITGNSVTNGRHIAATTRGGGGVYCGGGEVVNCRIYANISTSITDASGGAGACIVGAGLVRDCVISNNILTNVGGHAVHLVGGLLTNCTVINNQCGGISIYGSTPIVDACQIVGNVHAGGWYRGAGIYMYEDTGNGIVQNCRIINNVNAAGEGGGIYLGGGVITNCCISSNFAYYGGGGIYILSTVSPRVQDCTIVSNSGGSSVGGGVNIKKTGTLRNCLIVSNTAPNGGGVEYYATDKYTSTVENCTIVDNRTTGYGGGVRGAGGTGSGSGRVINTIIMSNTAATAGNNWYTNDNRVTFTNCCTTPTNDLPGSGNITNNPAFVDYAARNFRLARGSPCVNTGIMLDWMSDTAVDLDGRRRLDGFSGRPDIGCYEFVPAGTMFRVR